ncbi:hypothetical protein [Actinokineospora inagensis]|nr:hypothetical protein [Actinokineospora inagensis]
MSRLVGRSDGELPPAALGAVRWGASEFPGPTGSAEFLTKTSIGWREPCS